MKIIGLAAATKKGMTLGELHTFVTEALMAGIAPEVKVWVDIGWSNNIRKIKTTDVLLPVGYQEVENDDE